MYHRALYLYYFGFGRITLMIISFVDSTGGTGGAGATLDTSFTVVDGTAMFSSISAGTGSVGHSIVIFRFNFLGF